MCIGGDRYLDRDIEEVLIMRMTRRQITLLVDNLSILLFDHDYKDREKLESILSYLRDVLWDEKKVKKQNHKKWEKEIDKLRKDRV